LADGQRINQVVNFRLQGAYKLQSVIVRPGQPLLPDKTSQLASGSSGIKFESVEERRRRRVYSWFLRANELRRTDLPGSLGRRKGARRNLGEKFRLLPRHALNSLDSAAGHSELRTNNFRRLSVTII
jgi:hypothetical protein